MDDCGRDEATLARWFATLTPEQKAAMRQRVLRASAKRTMKRHRAMHDSGTTTWPARRGFRMIANMERYISIDDEVCSVVSAVRNNRSGAPSAPLPASLGVAMRQLGASSVFHRDVQRAMDLGEANELWTLALAAARHSRDPRMARWLDRPDTLDGWTTLVVLATALAHGMRYPRLPFTERARAEPWGEREGNSGRRATWQRRLEAVELLIASMTTAPLDVRPIGRSTRIALREGARGVCRHYAAMLQALFAAMKQATGRLDHCHVITIRGSHSFASPLDHAWNWFVDERSNRIVALDVTGADWLLDRGDAESVINRGFDGSRWNNVSAFLATLFYDGLVSEEHHALGAALLPKLVRPSTVRGQALLYRLAQQSVLHPDVRDRIVRALASRGLDRAVPGWRLLIRLQAGLRRDVLARALDPRPQLALLDALGLE